MFQLEISDIIYLNYNIIFFYFLSNYEDIKIGSHDHISLANYEPPAHLNPFYILH